MGIIVKVLAFWLSLTVCFGAHHRRELIASAPVSSTPSGPTPDTNFLVGWYAASKESYSDTDVVTNWHDFSGLGNNATNATGATSPVFKTNQLNGQPAMLYNRTNFNRLDRVDFVGLSNAITPGVHVIAVVRDMTADVSNPGQYIALTDAQSNNVAVLGGAGNTSQQMYSMNKIASAGSYSSDWRIRQGSFNSNDQVVAFFANDYFTPVSTTALADGPVNMTKLTLGLWPLAPFFLNGYLAECLIYATNLQNTSILTNTIIYLTNKYGAVNP